MIARQIAEKKVFLKEEFISLTDIAIKDVAKNFTMYP